MNSNSLRITGKMKQLLPNVIEVDELLSLIGKLLDEKLDQALIKKDKHSQVELLSRKEVAGILKISLPTLHEWTKLSWIASYKIGNKVFYKKHEIDEALNRTNFKYKKGIRF